MSEHPPDEPDRPAPGSAIDRISRLTDSPEEDIIHAVAYLGQAEKYWFYIAVVEWEYDGNEYLNERYAQLVKPEFSDEREDTWKKNGINRRVTDRVMETATILSFVYREVAERDALVSETVEEAGDHIDPTEFEVMYFDTETEVPEVEVDD